ncbi:hypothetical protein KU6B_17260 [Mameliella alba]|nr:hypothetical protein KU6B_17260 [Mameliella alba]
MTWSWVNIKGMGCPFATGRGGEGLCPRRGRAAAPRGIFAKKKPGGRKGPGPERGASVRAGVTGRS